MTEPTEPKFGEAFKKVEAYDARINTPLKKSCLFSGIP